MTQEIKVTAVNNSVLQPSALLCTARAVRGDLGTAPPSPKIRAEL